MPSWLPTNNLAGLGVSSLALLTSLAGFLWALISSRRQFSQAYFAGVAEWLANVLASLKEASDLIDGESSDQEKRKAFKRISDELNFKGNTGFLYFGSPVYLRAGGMSFPYPLAIVFEAASTLFIMSKYDPLVFSNEERFQIQLSGPKIVDEVTSMFKVERRLKAATGGSSEKRPLTVLQRHVFRLSAEAD